MDNISHHLDRLIEFIGEIEFIPQFKKVSGTYRSPTPSYSGFILELRVDVDGRRPQNRVSGDFFSFSPFFEGSTIGSTTYLFSFVVESLDITQEEGDMVITGPVIYYNDATRINDTIHVRIPRILIFSSAKPDANVSFFTSGALIKTYCCAKISEFFRTVSLEIDRFQGTTFPPAVSTDIDPHPADLGTEEMNVAKIFRRAGIDMTVEEDDVLNDPDSDDPGNAWDLAELHDLMEDHFDSFADILQWHTYGVVVPSMGAGFFGAMFDWDKGGGDGYGRQGAAVAYDTIQEWEVGDLYDTPAKKDRLFLTVFVHEIGHSFNLPHPWARSVNRTSTSATYMGYPSSYGGGLGATPEERAENFWSDFRWEFDDVELMWIRHADRNDVIFGGRAWIGNNLSVYTEPEIEKRDVPLTLEVRAQNVLDFGVPVRVELKLTNVHEKAQFVVPRLAPEEGLVTVFIRRPNGDIVKYIPPVRKFMAPGDKVRLSPGESIYDNVLLSFGAKGPQFQEPGEYIIRAYYNLNDTGLIFSKSCRLRVAAPFSRNSEELAHLLFSRETTKFLYFGGTERYPEVISHLEEAVKKYAESDPVVVRHIHSVLGLHKSRAFKRVITQNGKRVVVPRRPNIKEAISHLEAARELSPKKNVSALDNITYNKLSVLLAECHIKQGKNAAAEQTLRESLQYLDKKQVVSSVLKDYENRIKSLQKRQKS